MFFLITNFTWILNRVVCQCLNNAAQKIVWKHAGLIKREFCYHIIYYPRQWNNSLLDVIPACQHAGIMLGTRALLESLRFPQLGRQRERHNSFLLKNKQQKSTINNSLGNLWCNELKKSLRKKIRRKPDSGYQKKIQVDLQTLQFGRGSCRNLKTVSHVV